MAQYRAIFKRAYVKGIASAVLLTAGLAAGAAQAADTLYFKGSGGNWELNSGTSTNANAMIAASLGGNQYDGTVSGGSATTTGYVLSGGIFHIGGDDNAKNYLSSITSGTAVGGYANAKTGDMEATDNHIYVAGSGTVTAGDGTPSSRGLIYGAYVTAQAGLAKATANSVIVQKDKAQVGTAAADDGYIGGRAQGAAGATVESNKVSITGYDGSLQVVNASDNEYDVIGGLALTNEDNSTGTYQANQNIVDLQYIKVTDAGAANKGFNITGGLVAPDGDAAYTVVAQGNQVTVANSDLATTNSGKLTVKIVGDHHQRLKTPYTAGNVIHKILIGIALLVYSLKWGKPAMIVHPQKPKAQPTHYAKSLGK